MPQTFFVHLKKFISAMTTTLYFQYPVDKRSQAGTGSSLRQP
jgi:hypothetical protein